MFLTYLSDLGDLGDLGDTVGEDQQDRGENWSGFDLNQLQVEVTKFRVPNPGPNPGVSLMDDVMMWCVRHAVLPYELFRHRTAGLQVIQKRGKVEIVQRQISKSKINDGYNNVMDVILSKEVRVEV